MNIPAGPTAARLFPQVQQTRSAQQVLDSPLAPDAPPWTNAPGCFPLINWPGLPGCPSCLLAPVITPWTTGPGCFLPISRINLPSKSGSLTCPRYSPLDNCPRLIPSGQQARSAQQVRNTPWPRCSPWTKVRQPDQVVRESHLDQCRIRNVNRRQLAPLFPYVPINPAGPDKPRRSDCLPERAHQACSARPGSPPWTEPLQPAQVGQGNLISCAGWVTITKAGRPRCFHRSRRSRECVIKNRAWIIRRYQPMPMDRRRTGNHRHEGPRRPSCGQTGRTVPGIQKEDLTRIC